MATVIVTFKDNEDDTVGITVQFDPEIPAGSELTSAQHVALSCLHRAKGIGEGSSDE